MNPTVVVLIRVLLSGVGPPPAAGGSSDSLWYKPEPVPGQYGRTLERAHEARQAPAIDRRGVFGEHRLFFTAQVRIRELLAVRIERSMSMAAQGSTLHNVAVVGQETSGKTTLMEAILLEKKVLNRLGSVEEKNVVCDFEPEEKEQKKSIFPAVVTVTHKGSEVTLVDVPGALDFLGQALPVLNVVECALCCVDAPSGVKITSRRVWKELEQRNLPRMVVVTRQDAENADFARSVSQIQEAFGPKAVPLYYPDGAAGSFTRVFSVLHPPDDAPEEVKAARESLVESIVESDEALMEKYLEGEEISDEDLHRVFRAAVREQELFPVFVTAAAKGVGVPELLDALVDLTPVPAEMARTARQGDEDVAVDPAGPFLGQVFKVWADDFLGRLSYLRIFAGTMATNGTFVNLRTGETEKYGNVLGLLGKETKNLDTAGAGQIVAVGKVENIAAGDTLAATAKAGVLPRPALPRPLVSLAVQPKSRDDEKRLSGSLGELAAEDPCFESKFEGRTKEQVISGLSDFHLNVMLKRMKRRRKVELTTTPPLIPYLETVTKPVKYVEYTHKKQTGGAGQFARVFIDLEPLPRDEGYEFADKIFGGAIDAAFRGSVDKGIQAKMEEGVLAGYPVVDVRVSLVDGKMHPVDSKDIAFQIAGREAFKKAFEQAGPVLLEPIVTVEITIPQQYMGDIMGDLNGRRGRIQNTTSEGALAIITASVPLAEIQSYAADLKSITGGEGTYVITPDKYDVVPAHMADQVVAKAKAGKEEAK
jgi:elongation factor G